MNLPAAAHLYLIRHSDHHITAISIWLDNMMFTMPLDLWWFTISLDLIHSFIMSNHSLSRSSALPYCDESLWLLTAFLYPTPSSCVCRSASCVFILTIWIEEKCHGCCADNGLLLSVGPGLGLMNLKSNPWHELWQPMAWNLGKKKRFCAFIGVWENLSTTYAHNKLASVIVTQLYISNKKWSFLSLSPCWSWRRSVGPMFEG